MALIITMLLQISNMPFWKSIIVLFLCLTVLIGKVRIDCFFKEWLCFSMSQCWCLLHLLLIEFFIHFLFKPTSIYFLFYSVILGLSSWHSGLRNHPQISDCVKNHDSMLNLLWYAIIYSCLLWSSFSARAAMFVPNFSIPKSFRWNLLAFICPRDGHCCSHECSSVCFPSSRIPVVPICNWNQMFQIIIGFCIVGLECHLVLT